MRIVAPEEIKKLRRIFEPYLDGVKLKEDAPQEAKKAHESYFKWYDEEMKKLE